jgi:hypothetical protein
MVDLKNPLTRAVTEESVRAKLLDLASEFVDRAKGAADPAEAQTYAESAAVVFSSAQGRLRAEDVPPDGG